MPTYEYRCDACGHAFEKFQSIKAPAIKRCPKCGKNKVRRLISSGAGLIFKGSGFYITDYRDKSYTDSAKADSGSTETKAGDAKGAETKTTDAKSDSKSSETKSEKPAEKKSEAPKTEAKHAKKKK